MTSFSAVSRLHRRQNSNSMNGTYKKWPTVRCIRNIWNYYKYRVIHFFCSWKMFENTWMDCNNLQNISAKAIENSHFNVHIVGMVVLPIWPLLETVALCCHFPHFSLNILLESTTNVQMNCMCVLHLYECAR